MLTKSKFKIGCVCPTQLYYHNRPDVFDDQNIENPFLEALAEGGFQVGEMAKFLIEENPQNPQFTIDEHEIEKVLEITKQKLANYNNINLAEAGFQYEGLYVRVDLLEKKGNLINIYEVKSSSIGENETFFNTKTKNLESAWIPYLLDIAFQYFVVNNALNSQGFSIKPHLVLVNKSVKASRNGLNQFFKISSENDFSKIVNVTANYNDIKEDLKLLTIKEVSTEINWLFEQVNNHEVFGPKGSFSNLVNHLININENKNKWIKSPVGAVCKSCSYYSTTDKNRCGRTYCFSQHDWSTGKKSIEEIQSNNSVMNLWLGKGGGQLSKQLWALNIPFISELNLGDFYRNRIEDKIGFTPSERRQIQIELSLNNDVNYKFNSEAFIKLKSQWEWPLNMIDFETNTSAIPFFKGMKPYQTVAFQFSHHIIEKNGRIIHQNQWLSYEPGRYPNFDFVRALRESLMSNSGTIFRYATHENTVLNQIKLELIQSTEEDKNELIDFIEKITEEKVGKAKVKGERNMVDLLEVVLSTYYSKYADGSNSIKAILPAILNDIPYLKEKYANPTLYGKGKSIESLNFEQHTWLSAESKGNPYKTLPPVFINKLNNKINLADGGAAMSAYNLLQFQELTDYERFSYKNALLRYCELDTMAMVMVLEGLFQLEKLHT